MQEDEDSSPGIERIQAADYSEDIYCFLYNKPGSHGRNALYCGICPSQLPTMHTNAKLSRVSVHNNSRRSLECYVRCELLNDRPLLSGTSFVPRVAGRTSCMGVIDRPTRRFTTNHEQAEKPRLPSPRGNNPPANPADPKAKNPQQSANTADVPSNTPLGPAPRATRRTMRRTFTRTPQACDPWYVSCKHFRRYLGPHGVLTSSSVQPPS